MSKRPAGKHGLGCSGMPLPAGSERLAHNRQEGAGLEAGSCACACLGAAAPLSQSEPGRACWDSQNRCISLPHSWQLLTCAAGACSVCSSVAHMATAHETAQRIWSAAAAATCMAAAPPQCPWQAACLAVLEMSAGRHSLPVMMMRGASLRFKRRLTWQSQMRGLALLYRYCNPPLTLASCC